MSTDTNVSKGVVVQIIGAVVDVEFPQDKIPKIYNALQVVSDGSSKGLILEVQQQIGGGMVRCITMGSSDGLKRGAEVIDTGDGIKVPVGHETLGRIMNEIGRAHV